MKTLKKTLAIVLSAVMVLSLTPALALAADGDGSGSDGVYVLMNIPYGDFYKAELGENAPAVDAVTSATKNKPRTGGLAGGSYHTNPDGTDISGVVYPVFVSDSSKLEGLTEITDESSVEITVTNRGQTATTTYSGKDALFESGNYSYYKLTEKPALYKTMTVSEDGTRSFGAVSGEASVVEGVTYKAAYNTHHHYFEEIELSGTTGIAQGDAVSGGIITFSDGSQMALRHVVNIWRTTGIGGDKAGEFSGKTITNVRYYTQTAVIDYPVNIPIKKDGGTITAAFDDVNTLTVTGLPEDVQNPVAKVQSQVGWGETPVILAENAAVTNGKITTTGAAVDDTTYVVSITSDNYADLSATAKYTAPAGEGFLAKVKGEYQPLFKGATFNKDYVHYWHDYAAAVVGNSAADETVAYMKTSIGAEKYGVEAEAPNFFCGFANDVAKISFGGEDGKEVTFTERDGSKEIRTYEFVKDADATGKYGEHDMAMSGYLYKAQDAAENDPFAYLLMFPDTPETTYHLEFRYGDTEENVCKLLEGPYAYWVGSAIQTSALTEANEDTLRKVISLFVVENLVGMQNDETNAQRKGLAGTWDFLDSEVLKAYGFDSMYVELAADGTGKTYAAAAGTGAPALISEYTFFAYDPDQKDGKDGGTYIALNKKAETVTPGEYEIKTIDGKKALVFTSNEGVITYYLRQESPSSVFDDLDSSMWYIEGTDYVIANKMMNGTGKTTFSPNDTTTRAMIVTILWRLEGEPNAGVSSFGDVEAGSWYEKAVNWAAENKIVNGMAKASFAPMNKITREQLAAILMRYAAFKGADVSGKADLTSFTDTASVSDWAADAFGWAVKTGLMNGVTETTLQPRGNATRAQTAVLMQRLCENILK